MPTKFQIPPDNDTGRIKAWVGEQEQRRVARYTKTQRDVVLLG